MTFYVTFGGQYAREPHPVLGMRPDLPERMWPVPGDTYGEARAWLIENIGPAWCSLYSADEAAESAPLYTWGRAYVGVDALLAHHQRFKS